MVEVFTMINFARFLGLGIDFIHVHHGAGRRSMCLKLKHKNMIKTQAGTKCAIFSL